MKALRKGLEAITTLRGLVDRFHTRTPYGALIELARLSRERERLGHEIRRWEKRSEQIRARLEEIKEAEKWLYEIAAANKDTTESEEDRIHLREGLRGTVLRY